MTQQKSSSPKERIQTRKKRNLRLVMVAPEVETLLKMKDGTEIFVRMIRRPGADGIPLLLNDGLGCDGYAWKYLLEEFSKNHPILHWHYRGHGKSQVPKDLSTIHIDVVVDDLHQILTHFEIEKAVFLGHSMGVQVVLEAYKAFPDTMVAMVLLCGGPGKPIDTWHASFDREGPKTAFNTTMRKYFNQFTTTLIDYPKFMQPIWSKIMNSELFFRFAHALEVNPKRTKREDFRPYFKHLAKMDARVYAQMARSLAQHTAEDLLPQIDKPTLVISAGKDTFSPHWVSEDMHQMIPESEYLHIPDASHVAPLEHPELINLRIEKFLRERVC